MPLRSEFSDPRAYNDATTEEFRANGGQVTGDFAGRPLLLLTTYGAKTGDDRVTPLIYTKDGDSFVVTAADGGSDRHPGWYYNIRANPRVELQDGAHKRDMTAREITGDERAQWWDRAVAAYPPYAEYQRKTERVIPVFVLEAQ